MKNIRNFCIIAHIDHGKSTLADRLLEKTNTAQPAGNAGPGARRHGPRARKGHHHQEPRDPDGIPARDGEKYVLNLIDTPGHVDFSYEVSRAIASCEGALLVVDATQGIQAQTISNLYLAVEHDLKIIPVLNKIDMDSAMIDEVKDQVVDLLGCDPDEILCASGKTGLGVEEVLEAIVERIPAPQGDANAPLQALIFDSVFNPFRGIIAYFRVFNGTIRKGEHVKFFNTGSEYDADEVGVLKLKMQSRDEIRAGDVGYICSGIKTSSDVKVGDTITSVDNPCDGGHRRFRGCETDGLRGRLSRRSRPVRRPAGFARKTAAQRRLADVRARKFAGARASASAADSSDCCTWRSSRNASTANSTWTSSRPCPNVSYKITTTQGDVLEVHNPSGLPEITKIASIEEPYILAQIITKSDFLGNVHQALHRQAGYHEKPDLHHAGSRGGQFRDAPVRDRVRLLRQAQEHFQGLRLVRLSPHRVPVRASWPNWTSCSTANRSMPFRR